MEGLEHKLTSNHQAMIARNNALLAMYTSQVDLCRNLVSVLVANRTVAKEEEVRILAGALSRAGKMKEAVDILLQSYQAGDEVSLDLGIIA